MVHETRADRFLVGIIIKNAVGKISVTMQQQAGKDYSGVL